VKARELMAILRRLGAAERAGKGSHVRFTIGPCIKKGTLAAIEASLEPCLGKDWLKKIVREGR
jgi:predicted RNA binding protein YcfA (HicA-like mRNA interferase family)